VHRNISVNKSQNLRKPFDLHALTRGNLRFAQKNWLFSRAQLAELKRLTEELRLSIVSGELSNIGGRLYVTHAGLLRIAKRSRCSAIRVRPLREFSDPLSRRWVFKAVVHKSCLCAGFVGYGDADPSNVSPLVRGAEMRVAETRAVNRALRKAYASGCARSRNSAGNRRLMVMIHRRPLRLHTTMVITTETPASVIASVF
jgi:hypothetical protein